MLAFLQGADPVYHSMLSQTATRISPSMGENSRSPSLGNTKGPLSSQRIKVPGAMKSPRFIPREEDSFPTLRAKLYQGHLASEPRRVNSKRQQDDKRSQLCRPEKALKAAC